jgi:hypothetical protein
MKKFEVNEYGWAIHSATTCEIWGLIEHQEFQQMKSIVGLQTDEQPPRKRYKKGTVERQPLRRWQRLSAKAAMSKAKLKVEMQRMDIAEEWGLNQRDPYYWDAIDEYSDTENTDCECEACQPWRYKPNFREWQEACYCPSCREYRRYGIETLYCTEQPYFEPRAEHWYR